MSVACPNCASPNDDGAGACRACGAALPRVCASCAAVNGPTARFCSACGTPLAGRTAARTPVAVARGYLPKDLADRYLAAEATLEGEQRQVTILFIDLAQSTGLLRERGAERMADLLDELLGAVATVVYRYEGTIVDIAGDGALCVFGAPIAHEDDPERALRAAAAIREAVEALRAPGAPAAGLPLAVRMGVHTGGVVVRTIGKGVRLKYSAIGEAVHLAQRLESTAAPDEILVSAATQRLAPALFLFGAPETFTLKGFDVPVEAARLVGEGDSAERRTPSAVRTPFVGRDAQLEVFQARLEDLAKGIGGVVTLIGEAGMGKSRLLFEVRQRMPAGIVWLHGRAASYGQDVPYWVVGEQVRRAAAIGADDSEPTALAKLRVLVETECGAERAPEVWPFIAVALGMRLDAAEAARVEAHRGERLQHEMLRAFKELAVASARRAPIAIVFEDAHWSDRASAALVDDQLALIEDHPILYILVARPDTATPAWVLRQKVQTLFAHRHTDIVLTPLPAEAASRLAMGVLGGVELPREVRELVLRKAEGVPLYVEEVVRSLAEQGVLARDGEAWRLTVAASEIRVPDTLHGLVLSRLDRLQDPVKRVLQVASIIGRVVNHRVLEAVSDANGQLGARLRELQRLEFVRETRRQPEAEYSFKHAVIQDVVYQSLLGPRRKELHRKVAHAMESIFPERIGEFESILAEHFLRGEDWEKAAAYFSQAGSAARRLYAHVEARQHYAKALQALERLPDTVENRRRRVDAIVREAEVAVGAEPERRLVRLAEAEALAKGLPGPDGTAGGDRLRIARVEYSFGRARHFRNEPLLAMKHFQRVLALAEELGDEELLAFPSATLGDALIVQGQFGKARPLLARAVTLLERSGHWPDWIRATGSLGVALAANGEYAAGLSEARRGLARALEVGSPHGIGASYAFLGYVHLLGGDTRGMLEAADRSIVASDQVGDQIVARSGYGLRACAQGRLGDHAGAAASMLRSEAIRGTLAGPGALFLDDFFATVKAELALEAGRPADAVELAERAAAIGRQTPSLYGEGLAHAVWARALAASPPPGPEGAGAHFARSVELLSSGEDRLDAARTQAAWAFFCRDRGEHEAAAAHLEEAVRAFGSPGLEHEAERLRQLAKSLDTSGRAPR